MSAVEYLIITHNILLIPLPKKKTFVSLRCCVCHTVACDSFFVALPLCVGDCAALIISLCAVSACAVLTYTYTGGSRYVRCYLRWDNDDDKSQDGGREDNDGVDNEEVAGQGSGRSNNDSGGAANETGGSTARCRAGRRNRRYYCTSGPVTAEL